MRYLPLICLTAVCAGCSVQAPVTLVYLSDLAGLTEPCGCTSRPLGGLDHLAGHLEALGSHGPTGFLVLGNTFFSLAEPPPSLQAQEHRKAAAVAQVLQKLRPWAVVAGPLDGGNVLVELQTMTASQGPYPLPVVWQGVSGRQVELGGLKVGLVAAPSSLETQAINDTAATLRAQGSQFVVAAFGHGGQSSVPGLQALQGVEAVLLGGDDGALRAQNLGNTVVFLGGSKGEHLGALTLKSAGTTSWTYHDGGAAARQTLEARRDRLQIEAKNLPPGPAQKARQDKVAALNNQLMALHPTAPQGSTFTWQSMDIDQHITPAGWATAALAAYNRSLCAPTMAQTAARTCAPAVPGGAYVGNSNICQACHATAWQVYKPTAHARAWSTLTRVGKECDLTCVGCHTVGFEKPGGFCHLADAPKYANVGCEDCHGPAAAHVADPFTRRGWAANFVKNPGESTCRTCHTQAHSDQFDFATYLPKVLGPGHGRPIVNTPPP